MIRLVLIDCKNFIYKVFEGNKCIAEFEEENKRPIPAELVEQLRIANYKTA